MSVPQVSENFGGLHQTYDISPDIAMFGKAIGNGHLFVPVLGKKEFMDKANNYFQHILVTKDLALLHHENIRDY